MSKKELVIYEDKDFIVINKPAGVLVHKINKNEGFSGKNPILTDILLSIYPQIKEVGDNPIDRPGIVHRLDKDTSGIMIVPLTHDFFLYLKQLFAEHKVLKTYVALVLGKVLGSGVIAKPIGLRSGSVKRSTSGKNMKMIKNAITEYVPLEYFKDDSGRFFTLLRVTPKTGRTHQIRIHLASMGHPVLGDLLYGEKSNKIPSLPRQFLHAERIEFTMSDGRRMRIDAEMPEELKKFLRGLQKIDP